MENRCYLLYVIPFVCFVMLPQLFLHSKFRWGYWLFSWPIKNQDSGYEKEPVVNFLDSFLL